jgi:type I restriction enzyme R subunit
MEGKKFPEQALVEDYVIEKLQEKGWKLVSAEELQRESIEEPLLIPNLIRSIQRINRNLSAGDDEINRILNELKLTSRGHEGVKRILNFYKFGIPVKFEKDRVVKYVKIFDYEDIENNEFIVSPQVYYKGKDVIRTDIMLYINGIPLVNIECKNPTEVGISWYNAYRQIKDYEKIVPELYKYVQIGIAAESKAKYFPIIPWLDEVNLGEWREEEKDSLDSTIEILTREKLLDIIKDFLFFRIEYGNAEKVITRYMQYSAANKMVDRIIKNLREKEEKDKGLIWHWQGSGKTLTMIFAAHKLYYAPELENPSIFFIVDRIELEEQLYTEFYSLDIIEPEIIGSIQELKEVLSYDNHRGKRGIFIVLIHKFRPEELNELQKELENISEQRKTIMTRKNIIAFVDEGHRTQYGTLAAQMKSILKNAFFFALTGTPISKRGKDTYLEFSYPPEENYLDRYFIVDSIKDGFTVKIVYQPRLEHVHLKKDQLETFLEVELEEIPEYARDEVEEKLKARLNPINVFLENEDRIETISEDIAKHFKENVNGKFKAMVVAASRKACITYYDKLKNYLPEKYLEVVMTPSREREDISIFVKGARERYEGEDFKTIIKKTIEDFKESENPRILIVTDMLLTGFDAPILQYMYLDKPLKEHRLLQAVARTNRPYKDIKEAGVIIDYVGILKEFKRALEIYSTEDIEYALLNYDHLKDEFITLIDEIRSIFSDLSINYGRETLLDAIEILTTDVKKEQEFVEKYRNLRKVFELLGPNEVKLKYFEIYKWISAIYTYYMKIVTQKTSVNGYVKKYYDKTVRFIHKSTEIKKLDKELPIITFDEDFLEKLEEKLKSRKEKAANILFTLHRMVLVDKHKSPIYESLADRVEEMMKLWEQKTKDYELIYSKGVKIVDEINSLRSKQKKLGLKDLEYAMLLSLEQNLGKEENLIDEVRELSSQINESMFPGWSIQTTARKSIEKDVRRFVRGFKNKYNLTLEDIDDIYNKLIDNIMNYGI